MIKQIKVGDISLKLQNILNSGKHIPWRCIDMSLNSKIKNIIDWPLWGCGGSRPGVLRKGWSENMQQIY